MPIHIAAQQRLPKQEKTKMNQKQTHCNRRINPAQQRELQRQQ
ncbi:hypothetical protein TevJSym_ab01050 [endosymbiont of Tevnia jerichonana (vent Tica)]|uniref:Uncharacterized protein n=1 Tax=endosymbiont of Tevnia jerichonana (vent Tica) TaxID=1049564 RepID=G2FBS2_9GAMM|nr:hypothetical protein TevJSym_ab01050 [endosymbiont of Tevnia jerichonana (vent Tica)]